eukprot:CAMPEP_0117669000 /NCGR_PEP_ID=MMETSP0804-20121206/11874_1 /TAXON_ID=1074897 /ORGANISM="Tetraselmis astigmatica, Strain CCMP880" /LENGTH=441 /DNA_ID=CAMNT_0005476979 /DNA_START=56 /DNA_END=1377 /DNA_ORIENTATION=+
MTSSTGDSEPAATETAAGTDGPASSASCPPPPPSTSRACKAETSERQPAPFLLKTWNLVNDPASDHIISWSSSGLSFVVWNVEQFSKKVLPTAFKHSHFSSFVRQLNIYGFKKLTSQRNEFGHPLFVQGDEDKLRRISRSNRIQQAMNQPADGVRSENMWLKGKLQHYMAYFELVVRQVEKWGITRERLSQEIGVALPEPGANLSLPLMVGRPVEGSTAHETNRDGPAQTTFSVKKGAAQAPAASQPAAAPPAGHPFKPATLVPTGRHLPVATSSAAVPQAAEVIQSAATQAALGDQQQQQLAALRNNAALQNSLAHLQAAQQAQAIQDLIDRQQQQQRLQQAVAVSPASTGLLPSSVGLATSFQHHLAAVASRAPLLQPVHKRPRESSTDATGPKLEPFASLGSAFRRPSAGAVKRPRSSLPEPPSAVAVGPRGPGSSSG